MKAPYKPPPPSRSRARKRELEEDAAEPSDLEQDQAVKTNASAPKKQRTDDSLSGIAAQPDSVKQENVAAAGFCLKCVKRMSQGIFAGEKLGLKQLCDGPALCPACEQKKPWENLIEAYVESSKTVWEEHITLVLGSHDEPDDDKVCVLERDEGGEVDAWAIRDECQDLHASASKAREAAIGFAAQCVRWHAARAEVRAAANIFAQLQSSYADHVKRLKLTCWANDQLLHGETMREAAAHFRSLKMAQMSHDRYQAQLTEASAALQDLIRPALP